MRNNNRISNYWNRVEALRDWLAISKRAGELGRNDLIEKFCPPDKAGWKRIDRATRQLRAAIEKDYGNS